MGFDTEFTDDGGFRNVPYVRVDQKYGRLLVLPLAAGKEFAFGPKKARSIVDNIDAIRTFASQI